MWRDIKADGPEIDLLVSINARHHEEEAGTLGASGSQPAQPEDDRPLVFLDHLDAHTEGHRDGDQEEEEGECCDDMSTQACLVLSSCNNNCFKKGEKGEKGEMKSVKSEFCSRSLARLKSSQLYRIPS